MSGRWTAPAPVPVRMIENEWIETPDGVRLAIQLWLPDVAEPVPVVLESIPYRKRDATRAYSSWWGRQLAAGGVGYARLDVRGSGDSEGVLVDEYLPQEQHDAALAIAWLAAQPWSNGAVGMRGVSWGGFSTLQTAALAPPALKAIMPMCASDMRYTDDAHFVGGVFALTGLKWATSFKLVMAGPPDPEVTGPGWEAAWRRRLAHTAPIAARWLSHQRNDAYWRQGSVAADYGAIRCPTYVVGGWVDPYTEFVPRLLAGLTAPTKALIGPWRHGYPAPAAPGPGLEWLWEELRWWRRHLCGEDTGVMEGPRLWTFLPECSAIEAAPGPLPGRWAGAADMSAGEALSLRLAPGRLSPGADSDAVLSIESHRGVGLSTPEWVPFAPPTYPQEQSPDDARSLVFDSEPLASPLDILGNPRLRLGVASSSPVAQLAARLCEVTPDGRSWLVSYGVLNLTHRRSHASPEPLAPGVFEVVELTMGFTGRRLRAGSRLRLALSDGLWPLVWPAPEAFELRARLADACLDLPIRPPSGAEPDFPIPVAPGAAETGRGDPEVTRQHVEGGLEFHETWPPAAGEVRETGTRIERSGPNVSLGMRVGEPESCRWRASQTSRYVRGDWDCGLSAEIEITADRTTFHVRETLSASLRGEEIFERTYETAVPRDLM